ncbi:MAG: LysR family transcriptional regulator [Deltaproteobacteria bacterium]|nr:LysR family transcriptional regulator [Deltaproteobacteria bacterium]
MDLHQLKTFVVVAREGSITRASELLHLSQPAVSAHIKAIEDALDVMLFERTPRGMSLTSDGKRLLAKAEQTLGAHQELIAEASRLRGRLAGKLRIGAGSNSNHEAVGRLLAGLAETCPDVEVALEHGASREVLARLREGKLDVAFYNEAGDPDSDLAVVETSRFTTFLAAPVATRLDWKALAGAPWIYPTASACCGQTAEALFAAHGFRPKRIINVDREAVTRTLIAGGLGVGLLHAATAREAKARGEVDLLLEAPTVTRVLFATLASRAHDPIVEAALAIMRGASDRVR